MQLPAAPSKKGYSFDGYYPTISLIPSDKVSSIPVGSTGDKTYYGGYLPKSYLLRYEIQNNNVEIYDTSSMLTCSITNFVSKGKAVMLLMNSTASPGNGNYYSSFVIRTNRGSMGDSVIVECSINIDAVLIPNTQVTVYLSPGKQELSSANIQGFTNLGKPIVDGQSISIDYTGSTTITDNISGVTRKYFYIVFTVKDDIISSKAKYSIGFTNKYTTTDIHPGSAGFPLLYIQVRAKCNVNYYDTYARYDKPYPPASPSVVKHLRYNTVNWYDKSTGGNLIDLNSNYTNDSNMTLYGRWS